MVSQLVKSVSIALFSSLVATISLVGLATQSQAEIKDNFICGPKNGYWKTWVRDKDDNTKLYPFVRWVSYTPKEGSLQTRCNDVTYRLNAFYTESEIVRHGQIFYEQNIRSAIDEVRDRGKLLVINIETGEYEMDADDVVAAKRAKKRFGEAALFTMRIGYSSAYHLGRFSLTS